MTRSYRRTLPLALALVMAAGACIPTDEPVAARTPTAAPDARPGGTLRVALTPPDGIDPGNAHEPAGQLIARTMCDQLVAFDPLTGEPVPALAESWSVTRNGTKFFVKLRDGIRFSSGEPVTVEDVIFSLSRVASERFASRAAWLLAPVVGFGFVHGDEEAPSERARRELRGLTAADRRTIEITLAEPRADFIRVLAHPALSPVPQAAAERDPVAFARQPVCAGPYRVAGSWEPGAPVVLERNEGYDLAHPAYTRGGYADRIEFVVTDDPAAAYRRGEVDLARDPAASGDGAVSRVGPRLELMGFPTGVEPFDAREVRLAFAQALDREALAAAHPTARVATAGFAPLVVSDVHRPEGCGLPPRGDVEAARATLARSGIDLAGEEITLTFNDEFGNRPVARATARQWEAAFGVRVRLQGVPFEDLLQAGQSTQGLQGPFRYGWAPRVVSADDVLVPLFAFTSIGLDNLSRFEAGAFTDAIRAARRAVLDEDRVEAYRRAEDVVCDEMPMVPISLDVETWRARDTLGTAVGEWLSTAEAQPILREIFLR